MKRSSRGESGSVMMEYVILTATLALLLFAGMNNYMTSDAWLDEALFVVKETGVGQDTLGKDVAGMYQRVMAGICLPTP